MLKLAFKILLNKKVYLTLQLVIQYTYNTLKWACLSRFHVEMRPSFIVERSDLFQSEYDYWLLEIDTVIKRHFLIIFGQANDYIALSDRSKD